MILNSQYHLKSQLDPKCHTRTQLYKEPGALQYISKIYKEPCLLSEHCVGLEEPVPTVVLSEGHGVQETVFPVTFLYVPLAQGTHNFVMLL